LIYICMVSSIFVVAVAVVAVERSAFSSMPDGLPGDYHAIPTTRALLDATRILIARSSSFFGLSYGSGCKEAFLDFENGHTHRARMVIDRAAVSATGRSKTNMIHS
jgi:hypothetical protein